MGARALATQLPGVEESGVRILRLLSVGAETMKVEFEIEPAAHSQASALDRIEAQLLLMSVGQRATSRLQVALTEGLAASGLALPGQSGSLHLAVGAPQQ